MGLGAYLCISGALFVIGLCCIVARRHALQPWLGLALILNAASLNFVAFARFRGDPLDGHVFALLVSAVAAAEIAVAIAMFVRVARTTRR